MNWILLGFGLVASWRRTLLRAMLPMLGVMSCVAVIVAVDVAGFSVTRSFGRFMDGIEGEATHRIVPGPRGFPTGLGARLTQIHGVLSASEVIETMATAAEPLRMLGIDAVADERIRNFLIDADLGAELMRDRLRRAPVAVALSEGYLRRTGLKIGETLEFSVGSRRGQGAIVGVLPAEVNGTSIPDNLMLCDLATARRFAPSWQSQRIDLVVAPSAIRSSLDRVRALAPIDARIEAIGRRPLAFGRMLESMQRKLILVGILALLVTGFFLHTVQVHRLLRDRRELEELWVLGARPRQVFTMRMIEALAIGLVGAFLGVLLGVFLARNVHGTIALLATSDGSFAANGDILLGFWPLARGATAGVAVSLLATTMPAWAASRAMTKAFASHPEAIVLPRFRAIFEAIAMRIQHALTLRFGVVANLAVANLRAPIGRSRVTLAVLILAMSVAIAISTVVASFQQERDDWVDEIASADLYLSPGNPQVGQFTPTLEPELLDRLSQWPEVEALDPVRVIGGTAGGIEVLIVSLDIDVARRTARPELRHGPPMEVFFDRIGQGQVAISEGLQRSVGLRVGDIFSMRARGRDAKFRVAGVINDYSTDKGLIIGNATAMQIAFGSMQPNHAEVYLREGVNLKTFREKFATQFGGVWDVTIREPRHLPPLFGAAASDSFFASSAMEIVGITVAPVGILFCLLTLLFERRDELDVLHVIGLTKRQLRWLLVGESLLIALGTWLTSLLTGVFIGWVILRAVHLPGFAWGMDLHAALQTWLWTLAWVLTAALVAASIAFWQERRIST